MSIDLHPKQQQQVLQQAVTRALNHGRTVEDLPVSPKVSADELRQRIKEFNLEDGGDASAIIDATANLLESGSVLTTHPRYFGLFNPTPLTMGIAADVLTAGFNPQLAVWSHAPAATEIEARLIRQVGR